MSDFLLGPRLHFLASFLFVFSLPLSFSFSFVLVNLWVMIRYSRGWACPCPAALHSFFYSPADSYGRLTVTVRPGWLIAHGMDRLRRGRLCRHPRLTRKQRRR